MTARATPSSSTAVANASRAKVRSSRVCVAVTIVRTRALPCGTVGKPMPCANTPSSNSRSESFMASAASPTMTGVIGLSLRPVSRPRAASPALKKRVLSQSRSMRPSSDSSTSSAARQVAVTDGGCEVENRNGRALWCRNSISDRDPAT